MKRLILLAAALLAPPAFAVTPDAFGTPEQRCAHLSEYAGQVVIYRDAGVARSMVKEVAGNTYDGAALDAHAQIVDMVYERPRMGADRVRTGVLEGCMNTVNFYKGGRS